MNSDCSDLQCPANGLCCNFWREKEFTTDEGFYMNSDYKKPDSSIKLECTGTYSYK